MTDPGGLSPPYGLPFRGSTFKPSSCLSLLLVALVRSVLPGRSNGRQAKISRDAPPPVLPQNRKNARFTFSLLPPPSLQDVAGLLGGRSLTRSQKNRHLKKTEAFEFIVEKALLGFWDWGRFPATSVVVVDLFEVIFAKLVSRCCGRHAPWILDL